MLLALAPPAIAAEAELARHQFRAVDTLFANPGQGWMSQQRSPRGEPRFPCSVVYVRFNWADAEPEAMPRDWLPGEHLCAESVSIPATLAAGDYTLAVALASPTDQGRPFRLALDAPEKEGRYEVGSVTVECRWPARRPAVADGAPSGW